MGCKDWDLGEIPYSIIKNKIPIERIIKDIIKKTLF
jgi:hypothetical protein